MSKNKTTNSDYQTLPREAGRGTVTNKNYPSSSMSRIFVPLWLPSFHTPFPTVAQFPLGNRLFSFVCGLCEMVITETHSHCGSQSMGLLPPQLPCPLVQMEGASWLKLSQQHSIQQDSESRGSSGWKVRLEVSHGSSSRSVSTTRAVLGFLSIPNFGAAAFSLFTEPPKSIQSINLINMKPTILFQWCSDQLRYKSRTGPWWNPRIKTRKTRTTVSEE